MTAKQFIEAHGYNSPIHEPDEIKDVLQRYLNAYTNETVDEDLTSDEIDLVESVYGPNYILLNIGMGDHEVLCYRKKCDTCRFRTQENSRPLICGRTMAEYLLSLFPQQSERKNMEYML